MTPALPSRNYVEYAAERRSARLLPPDTTDASLDDRFDDELAYDTVDVCRKISQNGMISLDSGFFGDE